MKNFFTEALLLTKSYNLDDFKDWIFWYIDVLKFDHIVIFDNESEVDIESECLKNKEKITYFKIEGWPNQHLVYHDWINFKSESWWVFPVDDDEFLWVSSKYNNSINNLIIAYQNKFKDMYRLCVGWINLFPEHFIEDRKYSLIENAIAYSDEACKMWQNGNTFLKTIVRTTNFTDYKELGSIHNPSAFQENTQSYLFDGSIFNEFCLLKPMDEYIKDDIDIILFHYQFKSNNEWLFKCSKRKSPANKEFNKNHPEFFKQIYDKSDTFKTCYLMKELLYKKKSNLN